MSEPKKSKILVVDDNEEVCRFLSAALSSTCDVITCSESSQALAMVEEHTPHIIILDYNMPVHSGMDICKDIRAEDRWNTTPILILSAFVQGDRRIEFYNVGANDVLEKPIDIAELRAKVSVWVSLHSQGLLLANQNRELLKLSRKDQLTGLFNRRYGLEILDDEFARFRRYGSPSSLLFMDINNFKLANDTHGHTYGDDILIDLSKRLDKVVRETDHCIRYGGDEFLVIMPETDKATAKKAASRIQASLSACPLCDNPKLELGLSIGISSLSRSINTVTAWLEAADKAMYKDKSNTKILSRSTPPQMGANFDDRPTGISDDDRFTILLADDDRAQLRVTSKRLRHWGYNVIEAQDGNAALNEINKHPTPRIIVLDWMMPGISGIDVCRFVRANQGTVRPYVIIISALNDNRNELEAFTAGADDFIRKPYKSDDLRSRLAVGSRIITYEDQLIQAQKKQKAAEMALATTEQVKAMGMIAGGIAHEFNNINMSILGYAQLLLKNSWLPSQARHKIDIIHKAALRSSELSGHILSFSKNNLSQKEECKLEDITESTCALIENEVRNHGISIKYELTPTPPVKLGKAEIAQAILNLIINAKESLDGCNRKEIKIKTGAAEEEVWCSVTDTGVGIAPEKIDRVFNSVYTTKSGLPGRQGAGLGLRTSEKIILDHGGRITVKSTQGEGSTFTIYIPLTPPGEEGLNKDESANEVDLTGVSIVVADDEETILEILSCSLEFAGASVTACRNGEEALSAIRNSSIDLVVTDLQMPKLDGFGLIDSVRSDSGIKKPQWIVITGRADNNAKAEIKKRQIENLLKKPFSGEKLAVMAGRVMGKTQ